MFLRKFVLYVVAAAGMAAFQVAYAQPVRGCPEGEAVQSLHPNGTPVRCIPVPPPVNASVLQLIVEETAARQAADAELRASINEASIVGRYAFSGSQACMSASRGFNADFTPIMPSLAPPPPPGQPPQPTPVTVVVQSTATTTGFRTFNADGTGVSEFVVTTLNYPAIVYTNFTGIVNAQVSNGPPAATSTTQAGTFEWRIVDGKLITDDNVGNPSGLITAGGSRVGWTASTRNLPAQVGVLGKDLKVITLTHEAPPSVEISVLTSPPGQALQVLETPRICHRSRVLTKVGP